MVRLSRRETIWEDLRNKTNEVLSVPPEVHLLLVAQIGHDVSPFDISDVVQLVPQGSPLLVPQWTRLLFCLTSHCWGVEEFVDRWRCVSSNLRICFRALGMFLFWLVQINWQPTNVKRPKDLQSTTLMVSGGQYISYKTIERSVISFSKNVFTCS